MRKVNYIYSVILLLFPIYSVLAQSTEKNYIYIQEPANPVDDASNDSEAIRTVQYFDGLGRPEQALMIQATPEKKDIVTKIEYDGFGRQILDFLPVPTEQSSGEFINPDNIDGSYYNSPFWFSEKTLEASPLGRIMSQAAPGYSWAKGHGHEIEFEYATNYKSEVRLFYVDFEDGDTSKPILMENDSYIDEELYKTITKDENGHYIQEFKDKMGRVILKRTFVEDGSSDIDKTDPREENIITADTFYVYDIYGNLTFVIPPLAAANYEVTEEILENLCYTYRYDDLNRLIEKKLPGKGEEYMVYDKQNRLVAVQDANLRADGKWLFTKYDKFGRVVYTGIFSGGDRESVLGAVNTYYGIDPENRNNVSFSHSGFTKNGLNVKYTEDDAFPTSFDEILTVNYYDDYVGESFESIFVEIGNTEDIRTGDSNEPELNLKGMSTASFVRILGQNEWEKVYTAYDIVSRPIITHKKNHLGGYTQVYSELDFRGKPETTYTKHKRDNTAVEIEITEEFTYDHAERLTLHTHKTGNEPVQVLTRNNYDDIGQLINKKVGGNQVNGSDRWQDIDYRYNIRGWLTDINDIDEPLNGSGVIPPSHYDELFAFRIIYDGKPIVGSESDAPPLFNGNIGHTYWKTGSDNIIRGYHYFYDRINRLRRADFHIDGDPYNEAYKEMLAYDLNGNITKLFRNVGDAMDNAIDMDILAYSYQEGNGNSNRLINVTDTASSDDMNGFIDWNNHSSTGLDDYEYDDNGNMIKDRNKGIQSITYNYLNLPTEIYWDNEHKIEYLYNAAGEKVHKYVQHLGEHKVIDYLDGFQYAGNVLQFFPTSEGYVNVTPPLMVSQDEYLFNYVYNYTDHLGNIRVSYTKDPQTDKLKILDENHYYPFGLKHENYLPLEKWKFIQDEIEQSKTKLVRTRVDDYKYKFNGKELQDELGLGLYDYGWRNYDPAIGRWVVIDPKAEIGRPYSPYNYALNNPVYFIDPDGMMSVSSIQEMWDNTTSSSTWVNNGDGTYEGGENESDSVENGQSEDCCPNGKGFLKGLANSVIDITITSNPITSLIEQGGQLINSDFELIPRFSVEEGEQVGYYAGIILFAIVEPSPGGEINAIKILIKGGKATKITKAVNSNLQHAIDQSLLPDRNVFKNADEARTALEALTKQVGTNKLPAGTIIDPSKTDRILVPVGNNGMAVYQIGSNGTAKIKTVLVAK